LYRVVAGGKRGLKQRTAIVKAQGKWNWWEDFRKKRLQRTPQENQ
jgi:hypothetical protein